MLKLKYDIDSMDIEKMFKIFNIDIHQYLSLILVPLLNKDIDIINIEQIPKIISLWIFDYDISINYPQHSKRECELCAEI